MLGGRVPSIPIIRIRTTCYGQKGSSDGDGGFNNELNELYEFHAACWPMNSQMGLTFFEKVYIKN